MNKLTEAETERLVIMAEECAEVIQVIGKILRHGWLGTDYKGICYDNRVKLEYEISHQIHAYDLMVENGDLNTNNIQEEFDRKKQSIKPYLRHQTKLKEPSHS